MHLSRLQLTALCLLAATSTASFAACEIRSETGLALFGDIHIHTGLSADAMLFGSRTTPDEAYAFATGKPISIYRTQTTFNEPVEVTIERPLDFAAVTDHAENIAAVSLCLDPESPVYDTEDCAFVRSPLAGTSMAAFSSAVQDRFTTMYTSETICGKDRARCKASVHVPWFKIQEAAKKWNQPCEFTTMVGYEYSPTERGSNLHHNVLFRNHIVMDRPLSMVEVPNPFDFYRTLKTECNDSGTGCEAIAIPHNSNISNGKMFRVDYPGADNDKERRALAQLRQDMVPVVESFQEKGDSECRNGLWNVLGGEDEHCNFEKYRDWQGAQHQDCKTTTGNGGFQNIGCVSRLDFTRYALAEGVAEQARLGVNSLKFGVVGATDNHFGTAADLEEWVNDGLQRPVSFVEPGRMSTGGMAGVWAEENTREAIFEAFKRREVFATSGPRIKPRLYAASAIDAASCDDTELLEQVMREATPMGGELKVSGDAKSPAFLVSALADPGTAAHPGTALQRLQLIKVWPGEDNEIHQAVYDVAVANGSEKATVDPGSCERSGPGAASLCAVWTDPAFNAADNAVYYARVLENPSCRHTGYSCVDAIEKKPAFCSDSSIPRVMQERAWTSPIWISEKP